MSQLPEMTPAERTHVLELGRGPRTPYEADATVHEQFTRQAERTPNAVAVLAAHGSTTYRELDRQADQLAKHLRAAGARPGTTIGVAFERSLALPAALLAILKTGAAYVPLDMSYPRERLAFMMADAGVVLVLADTESGAGALGDGTRVLVLEHAAGIDLHDDDSVPPDTTGDSPAYIMYTSGSTGHPKGVVARHRGITRLVRNTNYLDVAPHDTFAQIAPLAFDASTFEIWAPLLNGARLAIPRPGLLSIDDLGDFVESFGVTTMWLTASLFARVVERELPSFSGVRRLLAGGAVVSPTHAKRFVELYPRCRLAAGYGPTENTTFSTWCELPSAQAIGAAVPLGRPLANSTAYILDADLQPVRAGAIGELCVGGAGVAAGYANLPELTAERFVRDPYAAEAGAMLYRTGDRARFRPDGVIEFHGRADDQVKISGYRIELGEIEATLAAHPGIREAAVVVTPDRNGEKLLVAYAVAAVAAAIDEAALRRFIRDKLPAYMVPHEIRIVAALPLHPSGKIDRAGLTLAAALPRVQPQLNPAAIAPRTVKASGNTAAMIADIWRDALGTRQTPGPDVNFFDAGGDSLRLLRMHALLNERFGLALNIVDLFDNTTIAQLERLIAAKKNLEILP